MTTLKYFVAMTVLSIAKAHELREDYNYISVPSHNERVISIIMVVFGVIAVIPYIN